MSRIPFKMFAALVAVTAILSACGDDSSSGSEKGGGEEGTVETVEELGKCLSAFEGDTYFVKEKNGSYVCESGNWNPIPGVGECTDSLAAAGTVRKETHKALDNYGESLVCADSAWRPATDVEVALKNACVEKWEGKFRDDSTNKKKVVHYVCTGNLWREASEAELAAKALCTYKNYGSFATDSSDKENVKTYVCKDSLWLEASSIEQAAGKVCDAGNYGLFVADSSDKALPLYVCDGEMFRMASEAESATRTLCDSTLRGDTLNFYICTEEGWDKDTTSTLGNCTDKNEGEIAKEENPHRIFGLHATASDSSYVCDGSKKLWREATAGEAATGKLCTEKVDGDTLNWFVCHAAENDWMAVMTSGLGKCDADSLDSIRTEPNPNLKKGDSLFVCTDNGGEFAWEILKKSLLGVCDLKLQDSVRAETNFNLKTFDTLFVCDTSTWVKASKYDLSNNGVPCTGNLNAQVLKGKLCLDGKWKKASSGEVEMGAACLESTENVVSVEKGKVCKSGEWVAASAAEIATGKVCTAAIANSVANGYVCEVMVDSSADSETIQAALTKCSQTSDALYEKFLAGNLTAEDCNMWREASEAEKATGRVCSNGILDSVMNGYVCENTGWRTATAGEIATNKICNAALIDSVMNEYACDSTGWREASEAEIAFGSVCRADVADSVHNGFLCRKYSTVFDTSYYFRKASEEEMITGKECLATVRLDTVINGFACTYGGWNAGVTAREIYLKKACSSSTEGTAAAGNDSAFFCQNGNWLSSGSFVDSRDSQEYPFVSIGKQIWMAKNLNFAYNQKTSSLNASSFCYDNSADSCAKYGRIYLWSAAMDSAAIFGNLGKGCGFGSTCATGSATVVRGVCPDGWHLPSKSEFNTLVKTAGGTSIAGKALKSTSGWYREGYGTDAYGFSALPAGWRDSIGNFSRVRYWAHFWSSSESENFDNEVYDMSIYYDYKTAYTTGGTDKSYGLSVRCLKDID